MTTFAVPAPPRASTTPPTSVAAVSRDAEGNTSIDTPFAALTYLEWDQHGERIEGWPQIQMGDVLGDESDLRAHIAACIAFLDDVDSTGTNRLPHVPRDVEPPATPEDDQQAYTRGIALTAHALGAPARTVLVDLVDHAAHYDGVSHWWDTEAGAVAWTQADHDVVPELTDAGLLVGHRPTARGCQVAGFLVARDECGRRAA